ncbi:unnamed protein product [Lactuca saligna]|uniref:AAA+ ATPase domain-containing protein n=1 Tax=Lactuca saligna TaxID=75948 RepID=A0AA35YV69_LACSI|nr:unnamed protein product [Lactuca saligna]
MDGRRHSVDIPLSKALIALRRVRSLRDPSTNSLSRLSAFVDNLNWETDSTEGIVLDQVNKRLSDPTTYDLGLYGNSELYHGQTTHIGQSGLLKASQTPICENKSLSERYHNNYNDLPCMMPTSDYMEGTDSCNESMEMFIETERQDHNLGYKRRPRRKKHIISSNIVGGDIISCISSPCLSIDNSSFGGSDCGTPLYGETTPFSESPRSLSQKFRPKSFDELVGQNVVSKSLLNTILNQKITSFNLFHGPRGSGKTSAARIFAAALNCLSHEGKNVKKPCGECQECTLFFAGRSRDVKEVDSVSLNKAENLRYIIKNAMLPPVSSSFKVFIIDECQLMQGSTWSTLVNSLEEVSHRIIFIMITPDLSKLPRGAIHGSQRFHFPKIKESDIVQRLEKICLEEGLDYDQNALEFIATRSNGSLRDAEMTLEQLSLLGKRITISLTYELIGIVSDDELLELLALALSPDTSNTVKRARELMRSRIDPMQLISQLANLIMDILSGKFHENVSDVKRQFFERHTSEADLQQLNNALKILSETEKQLRASKNQTTWLTVALLQLSSSPSFNANDSSLCERTVHPKDNGGCCRLSSADESIKHLVGSQCEHNICESEKLKDKLALESIWNRALAICNSTSLSSFLQRNGNLASVCFHQGMAVVELEFHRLKHVSKAEKSWKLIATALQSALGCNVEIRISHSDSCHCRNHEKLNKSKFNLFNCSRGNKTSKQNITNSSENLTKEASRMIRNSDGNALSVDFSGQDPVKQQQSCCCFPGIVKHQKKIRSLDTSMASEIDNNNLDLPVSRTCFCKRFTCCNGVERQKKPKGSKVHCWKAPMFPLKKAWQQRLRQQGP